LEVGAQHIGATTISVTTPCLEQSTDLFDNSGTDVVPNLTAVWLPII
jgi:hypothetical protein